MKFLTKAQIANIKTSDRNQQLRCLLNPSTHVTTLAAILLHTTHTQARTSVYRLHYTLATCRGFCCSAPPCSLKPHGAPPERETAISSATIPAPSSQPAVYEVCISCSALLQLLTLCAKQ